MSADVVSEAAAAIDAALDALNAALVADSGMAEGIVRIAERIVRRTEALIVRAIDEVERSGSHRSAGHRSLQAWCRATVRWSPADVVDRARTLRLARAVPEALDALDAGDLPVASVRALARSVANSRCRDLMVAASPRLVEEASSASVDDFARFVRRVEQYLDADGAHRAAERVHAGRLAWVAPVGGEFHVRGRFGMAQGSFVREVFDRYVEAEFHSDPSRTPAQTRADALHAIFLAAAGGPGLRVPTVNVVIDQATFESTLCSMATGDAAAREADSNAYRCETLDGEPITPYDAGMAALLGYVRRVVLRSDGVVVGVGRRSRLFRGAAREAVWLTHGRRCVYPGCAVRTCDVDHRHPWRRDGRTEPSNGIPLCDTHNRWKHQRGYRVWRDPAGAWHTTLPDGTDVPSAV